MTEVIHIEDGRLAVTVKKGFRNWVSKFDEHFDHNTRLSDISLKTLTYLAHGKDKGTFYIYDLIMNLQNLGSGFEFNELSPKKKMDVIDRYLFLLDRIRFECMKRLEWLDSYPGEDLTLVDLVISFERLGPGLQAGIPKLSQTHPDYGEYKAMVTLDREAFVRRLIPSALQALEDYSTTL
jgi:hypothetical protein